MALSRKKQRMKQPDYMENGDGSYKTRTFVFESHKESLTVKIIEMMDPSYGMYVWPCSPVLAQYLWFNREHIKGKRILEIGAGTGLPGILAALLGARVTLSDSSPLGLKNCQRNALFQLGPIDIILGSDCFYDPKDFENIIVTVSYLLHQNPHGRFWCAYQIRSADYSMEGLLRQWNLVCVQVPLENFEADSPNLAGSGLPGSHTIEMLVMSVNTTVEPAASDKAKT
ncbi:hypothetical protein MTO96_032441 [Rhipicephalus appendiculatus]